MKCTGIGIAIRRVGADGQLAAVRSNPKPLPFAKVEAMAGVTLRAFFELRAVCYDGSTCELGCDTATDRLKGICDQAVAKQKFEVVVTRK